MPSASIETSLYCGVAWVGRLHHTVTATTAAIEVPNRARMEVSCVSVSESRSLSTITRRLIPRGHPCCVRHHKNTHLVGTIEPAHASFLSATNKKLRCICLLQLALTDVRYWHKADIPSCTAHVRFWGVKRTWPFALHMSAFDPKRTSGAISPSSGGAKC